jgi:hypothetical protein
MRLRRRWTGRRKFRAGHSLYFLGSTPPFLIRRCHGLGRSKKRGLSLAKNTFAFQFPWFISSLYLDKLQEHLSIGFQASRILSDGTSRLGL